MSSPVTFREEVPHDVPAVQHLLREAFWNLYQEGADEHAIARKLRASADFLPELTIVGLVDGKIVAWLASTKASVEGHDDCPLVVFGPLCVDPACQGQGIGSKLMREAISRARGLGYRGLIILGHPCYYERFGLRCSKAFGISDAEGNYPRGQMALDLEEGSLRGVSGALRMSGAFEVTPEDIAEAESSFAPKDKFKTPSQQMFDIAVGMMADDPYPPEFDTKLVWDRTPIVSMPVEA
mmetsp:Transcript_107600/g.299725  ORF Transcript_107600/g.299725 Transcript_107600/m.299725 type:complete len:238 (-) Transcript_107600:239-952(-)|eukprot:CAMPEP_0179089616 /NCGR_PEP_ID=MMETSP0796-20121207/40843_1 /TAXON_ID=73915 /ORGANISM="Pyrodinium bahamense, Strain pbaha01" /LENGTH=237 /DNA_ID=CAMNT_0020787175 /DNA_START=101 /DNA_END=814 /DNA_ORIENTATION=+